MNINQKILPIITTYLKYACNVFIVLFSINNIFCFEQIQGVSTTKLDFQEKIELTTEIELSSGFQFYWNELLTPSNIDQNHKFKKLHTLKDWTTLYETENSHHSSFGYGTYRIQFSLPKEKPQVSLYIPPAYSATKIWVNGIVESKTGIVGKTKDEVLHRIFSQIISLDPKETNFDVIIQVANFHHKKGGINKPLILGATKQIQKKNSRQAMTSMLFIGCIGFIGIFFLIFYVFYWNKDKAVLYFAILCFALSYITLSDRHAPLTVVFESIDWILHRKIEYFFLFLTGLAGSLFFNTIFSKYTYKLYPKIILYFFYALVALALFLPVPYFTNLPFVFFGLIVINLIYATYIIIKTLLGKKLESILLFAAMLQGAFVFAIHIYFFIEKNDEAIVYVNFGYIIAFISLSMLLMKRFSVSFKELEVSKNIAIQQKKEISLQSDKLKKINLKLEDNLTVLENYNAELDDFNHIVSHDLKSPLISIYSLVSFIEEDLKTTLNTETKNHLELLKGIVSKMEALINGLLEYAKVAKGKKQKTTFKLNTLIDKVVDIVDYQKQSKIILIDKNFEVFANEIELEHVFQNLISNAIKHNDKEKVVITIDGRKSDDEYIYSVSDNGPGIDPEYHTKIFKIFSQLEASEDVESTGIGLAIVKKIITENKGVITVDSEMGIGTTINFTWEI